METVKSSFQTTGIWLTDRINIDHNLFNPTIAYQNSEVTNNSWKNIVNFHVVSEKDVNNQFPHNKLKISRLSFTIYWQPGWNWK